MTHARSLRGRRVDRLLVLGLAACAAVPAAAQEAARTFHRVDETVVRNAAYVRREARASTFSPSRQEQAAIAVDADGSAVVVWESRRRRNGLTSIHLQRYDALGRRTGEEVAVHETFAEHQIAPSVALVRGEPWVAWEAQGASGSGAFLCRVGVDARPLRLGEGHGAAPALAAVGDTLLAAFSGPDGAVCVATFEPRGGRLAASVTLGRGGAPAVSAARGRGSWVAWAALDAERRPDGLRLVAVTDAGPGEVIRIDAGEPAHAIEPSVAALPGGGCVVAWMEAVPARDRYDVYARVVAADSRLGEPIRVAGGSRYLSGAVVAAARDGSDRFGVAWNESESTSAAASDDVRMRLYTARGEPLGAAFTATGHVAGHQALIAASNRNALAFGAQGQLVLAWSGAGGFGDSSAVHVSWLAPRSAVALRGLEDATPDLPGAAEVPAPERLGIPLVGVRREAALADPHEPPVFEGTLPQRRPQFLTEASSGFIGITNTGWTPPDPVVAAGPNHLVSLVNGGVAFFTKDGTRTFFQSLNAFLGAPSSTFVFDPRVLFDSHSGRWFCAATEHESGSRGYFTLGVSDDDDPNGTWFKYRFDVTNVVNTYFVDFPHIGIDASTVYLTSNNFGGNFSHIIYMLPKQPLLSGQPVNATWLINGSTTASASTGQHVGATPFGYLVNTGSGSLRVFSVLNPTTSPQLRSWTLSVPSFRSPGRVAQAGTSQRLWPVDARLSISNFRNGRIWVCHNVETPVVTRWYEIDVGNWPASGSPRIVQSGTVSIPGSNVFLPSIAVDAYGNALICAARADSSQTPQIVYFTRLANDPPGTFSGPTVVQTSPQGYRPSDRWGDYSSVQVDPRDQATFWLTHEYARDSNNWNTWIQSVRLQGPTLTASATSLQAAQGGAVDLTLDNPPWAGRGYVVLGGVSGTSPGLRLPDAPGIVNLDLNLDDFTLGVLQNLNTPTFDNFGGTLDANGRATARVVFPPLPVLAGRSFWFAYAQDGNPWDFASETVRIDLQ